MPEKVDIMDMFEWVDDKLLSEEVSRDFNEAQGRKPWPKQEESIRRGAALKQFLYIVGMAPDEFRHLCERVLQRGAPR